MTHDVGAQIDDELVAAAGAGHPISNVRWVPAEDLHANEYNPNNVAPNELDLLRLSLLEDGFTQPIVVTADKEIVDGFHRWTLVLKDEAVRASTGGLVPIVETRRPGEAERMASTIRHNRARGAHYIVRMAELVRTLIDDQAIGRGRVAEMLGMESEEVERLYARGGMPSVAGRDGFEKTWRPA